jgi:hypothetical protein
VEATGLEEDLERDRGQDSEEEEDEDEDEDKDKDEEGHEEGEEGHKEGQEGLEDGAGLYDEGVEGDGCASGSASSRQVRTSHLVRPPEATCEDNRVVIIPSGDGRGSCTFVLCFN